MTPTELERYESLAPGFGEALAVCLDKLRRRDLLSAEVETLLAGRGVEAGTRSAVLEFLVDRRFVDDSKTISSHISRRSGERGYGKGRIRAELIGRGAPEDVVDECLHAQLGDQAELERALMALRRRFRTRPDLGQAGRFLMGKGFDETIVESALERFEKTDDLPD